MSAPSSPTCREVILEHTPPLTDHQVKRTCFPCQTVWDCPSQVTGAAPPAGSLGHCSWATSGLSLQDSGLLPCALTTAWLQNLATVFVLPVEVFSDKAFVLFPTVGEVWSPGMFSSRKVHPNSHTQVSPLSIDDPRCVTCTFWEHSPKLL